jgi:hypothetical protein
MVRLTFITYCFLIPSGNFGQGVGRRLFIRDEMSPDWKMTFFLPYKWTEYSVNGFVNEMRSSIEQQTQLAHPLCGTELPMEWTHSVGFGALSFPRASTHWSSHFLTSTN